MNQGDVLRRVTLLALTGDVCGHFDAKGAAANDDNITTFIDAFLIHLHPCDAFLLCVRIVSQWVRHVRAKSIHKMRVGNINRVQRPKRMLGTRVAGILLDSHVRVADPLDLPTHHKMWLCVCIRIACYILFVRVRGGRRFMRLRRANMEIV